MILGSGSLLILFGTQRARLIERDVGEGRGGSGQHLFVSGGKRMGIDMDMSWWI